MFKSFKNRRQDILNELVKYQHTDKDKYNDLLIELKELYVKNKSKSKQQFIEEKIKLKLKENGIKNPEDIKKEEVRIEKIIIILKENNKEIIQLNSKIKELEKLNNEVNDRFKKFQQVYKLQNQIISCKNKLNTRNVPNNTVRRVL